VTGSARMALESLVVIDYHDVFAAAARADGEKTGLVAVDLAGDGNGLHVDVGGAGWRLCGRWLLLGHFVLC
jgi:hypothetical protein